MKKNFIEVEKILGNDAQIKVLYSLLKKRKFNISNTKNPEFADHKKFVISHPYRIWYLVKVNGKYIGSVYILKNNAIGVSIENHEKKFLFWLLDLLRKKHKPLKEIKSVRPPYFYVNCPPKNLPFILALEHSGFKEVQRAYSISTILP
ncbi:hypothetical protein FIT76_04240 [Candidatus Methylopumilus universalis]|uniref:hypothetical protein n=1 Tax=Candidatus Methylopumilus universalis TaxID=2588536 RepID=UPI00112018BC|nr:hypothetical protein [Candidatus Methylopumilus universalis]QDC47516.1 hypothetical protein FIT76_04240 [Candidatus Methylopumilus universalis]